MPKRQKEERKNAAQVVDTCKEVVASNKRDAGRRAAVCELQDVFEEVQDRERSDDDCDEEEEEEEVEVV